MRSRKITALVFAICLPILLGAQVERVLPRNNSSSLEGTKFVVGFMANEIIESGIDPRLQIFICSQYDAVVTVTSPVVGSIVLRIRANTVYIHDVTPYHVVNAFERAQQKAVFVDSDVPIVVYALNSLMASSDSYTAIPIKHLGYQYYTVNRPTDRYPINSQRRADTLPRVGEFMIMAVEPNTWVEITPAVQTRSGYPAGAPFTVLLQRGECYQVQAFPTVSGGGDLTGSFVLSSAPVALLSGHQRTSVPRNQADSKDHLVEQLPPVNLWGKEYATTPFSRLIVPRPDVVRVMASVPNQVITVETAGGVRSIVLANPGSWRDTTLSEPAYWKSSDPFFVTQFMPSKLRGDGVNINHDPAMVVVPATEHFVQSALFQFPILELNENLTRQEFFYFVNLVVESSALPSLRLDLKHVIAIEPAIYSQRVPGTNLHWVQLKMDAGAHNITSDTGTFSGIMYGTTYVDSYANMIGVSYSPVKRLDASPPVYALGIDCGVIKGTISDVSSDTALLKEVTVITANTFNYRWQISAPMDEVGTVQFDADVRDLTKDAQIVIHAYDSQGNGKEWIYKYNAPKYVAPREIVVNLLGLSATCSTAVVRNTATVPMRVVGIKATGHQRISLQQSGDIDTLIAPGDSIVIAFCIDPSSSDTSVVLGWITASFPCDQRVVITVRAKTLASVRTANLDFGVVRVGDTVCSRIPVINDGFIDVRLDSVAVSRIAGPFTNVQSNVTLPAILKPGDTIWVSVCISPDTTGTFTRTDTLVTTPRLGLNTIYTGRGVAPRVGSIAIDWGRRRLGSVNDTTFTLRNTGSGWCVVGIDSVPSAPVQFNVDGTILAKRLSAGESVVVSASYSPETRGPTIYETTVNVDWSRHAPVDIFLRGLGTMPDIEVRDIDLGVQIIGLRTDSLAVLAVSGQIGGNEPLTVYSVRVVGKDTQHFTVPGSLRTLQGMSVGGVLQDIVSFVPAYEGVHECFVEIEHDGGLFGTRNVARFRIYGVGAYAIIPVPTLDASINASIVACNQTPLRIRLGNTGNGTTYFSEIRVHHGSLVFDLTPTTGPIEVLPDSIVELLVDIEFVSNSPEELRVEAQVLGGELLVKQLRIIVNLPAITMKFSFEQASHQSVGLATALIELEQLIEQLPASVPEVVFSIPIERFVLTHELPVAGVLTEGTGLGRSLPVVATQTSNEIRLVVGELVKAPWKVNLSVPGVVLWRDPTPVTVRARALPTGCADASGEVDVRFTVEPCGAKERVVRLGALAMVEGKLLNQPSKDQISLEVSATRETTVSVVLETLQGERIFLNREYFLQKGQQHCNFSCSGLPAGFYRLVFRGTTGVLAWNVLIVN